MLIFVEFFSNWFFFSFFSITNCHKILPFVGFTRSLTCYLNIFGQNEKKISSSIINGTTFYTAFFAPKVFSSLSVLINEDKRVEIKVCSTTCVRNLLKKSY
jgi:hypothetical protein